MATPHEDIEALAESARELAVKLDTIEQLIDPSGTEKRVSDLEFEMNADGFWDDQSRAAKVGAEHTRAKRKISTYQSLVSGLEDITTMLEMARESNVADQQELLSDIPAMIKPLEAELDRLQEEALFNGEFDSSDAIVSIQAGEGGVDAQDWAEMLVRMYMRFADSREFVVEVNAESPGDEAGIRSSTFTVKGEYAYGIFNAESGIHRLVRLSPFDSANRRHTSFAQVEVTPLFDDEVELDLDESDIRVDTYRASGAGGQHINKTESAVRLTHEPTGVVVQCQNERSQHQNRDTAMKMLRGKLYQLQVQEREATINAEKGEAQNIGFGSQIRSYVLQPYQMVKDLRTRHETGNVSAVLDGDLDEFIRTFLLHRAEGGSAFRDDGNDDE